jgi:PAS domain S-box-containing protein
MSVTASSERGWAGLFRTVFKRSRNAMVLLDAQRRHVDVNGAYIGMLGYPRTAFLGRPAWDFVAGGPLASEAEWRKMLVGGDFTGQADLVRSDGGTVTVQYAAHPETVTGRRYMLFVALQTSRRGRNIPDVRTPPAGVTALSAREMEVVGMLAEGGTSADIAAALHVSNNTVRTHVRNAMAKLDVRSRAQLVAKALGEGLVLR